jgi:hypothetical protein
MAVNYVRLRTLNRPHYVNESERIVESAELASRMRPLKEPHVWKIARKGRKVLPRPVAAHHRKDKSGKGRDTGYALDDFICTANERLINVEHA